MMAISRLKRRPEYLRVAGSGLKAAAPGLVLQARKRDKSGGMRVGFTASRRVGGAVARNRAKRRLRAVAEDVMPNYAVPDCDYVLIARSATLHRPYGALRGDLKGALKRLGLCKNDDHSKVRKAAV
jgi:ribonuclease P protein component